MRLWSSITMTGAAWQGGTGTWWTGPAGSSPSMTVNPEAGTAQTLAYAMRQGLELDILEI